MLFNKIHIFYIYKRYYLPILVNGIGASMISAVVYPAVPLVVDHKVLGSAFGI